MKIFKINQKAIYVLSSILVAFFLYGCKEKELNVSVFDGLPESTFLTEMKTSLENHTPLAIAFTAEWCPHCRQYKPVFSEVKDLYRDKITFINIDVDDANGSPVSNRFQVRGIPTTGFVRADGSVYKVQVGEITKDDLVKIADELIASKKRKKGEPVAPFPLDINKKEEAVPAEQKQPVKEEPKEEETKPAEEAPVMPPAQEEPQVQPPSEEIQPPPAVDNNEQNDSLDSGNDLKDDETPPEVEVAPGQ